MVQAIGGPTTRPGSAVPSFADVLRGAIGRRGLGLERIKHRLDARGASVSVATLSYWQSGRSQPERRRSLAALPHLEEVLDLEPGALRAALAAPRERGRPRVEAGLATILHSAPHLRVLHRLDTRWEAELERVSLHDVLTVDADRSPRSLRVRQVLRARCDGPDRRVILHGLDDRAAAPPRISSVLGCSMGRTERDPTGLIAAELLFFQTLRRGETVLIEYEMATPRPRTQESHYHRALRPPTREYVLQVRFDPAAEPASCERFGDGDGDVQPLRLDAGHSVHLVEVNCPAGILGIRWSWPS